MQGTPLRTVQELLGHADIRMTIRYAHLSPSHLAEAVTAIEALGCESAVEGDQNLAGKTSGTATVLMTATHDQDAAEQRRS
jgi:Phage integrase family